MLVRCDESADSVFMLHDSQNVQSNSLPLVVLLYEIWILAHWRQETLGFVFGATMLHATEKMATKCAKEERDTQLHVLRTINFGSSASFIRSRLLGKA